MSAPVDPVQPAPPERRGSERRGRRRRAETSAGANLPVVVRGADRAAAAVPEVPERLDADTAFAAQLLGQPGQKRGLKGGRETLERAREAYLEAQWTGPHDRRIPRGRVTKTKA